MRRLLLTLAAVACLGSARAQLLAVGTDVAMDLLMIPSANVEVVVGERSTIGVSLFGSHKPWGKAARTIGVQPEFRYYFSGRSMHQFFVGVGAVAADYDITWKGKTYDGYAAGAGLTFGYVFKISRRLNIDLHAGCGLIGYRQKEYFEGDHYEEDYAPYELPHYNSRGLVILPTRIGVSVMYILK